METLKPVRYHYYIIDQSSRTSNYLPMRLVVGVNNYWEIT